MTAPPYGPGSRIVVMHQDVTPEQRMECLVAVVHTPGGPSDPVATSNGCDLNFFRWMVAGAASFHLLPLIDETGTRPSISCPRCQRTSWHPKDVETGYCGACHLFNPPAHP